MPGPGFITSESAEITSILDEPDTVFLVFANPSDAQIQPLYNDALNVIEHNNPGVWRVLWVKSPDSLNQALSTLFWPTGRKQAVVLSLGTGINRVVKASYDTGQLTGAFDISEAFSQG